MTMDQRPTIAVDIGAYAGTMNRAVEGHVADMKTALRAIEDGSFIERATARRPDAVIHFTTSDRALALEGAAQRVVRTCYRAIVTELVAFMDSLVAVRRLLIDGCLPPPGHPLNSEIEIRSYANVAIEAAIAAVGRDRSLANPQKIDEIGMPSAAAETLKELLLLRHCLEHHRGIPDAALTIRLKAIKALLGDRVVDALPALGREGEGISIRMDDEVRTFPEGQAVALTEADIEQVAFTLMLLGGEIAQLIDTACQSGTLGTPGSRGGA